MWIIDFNVSSFFPLNSLLWFLIRQFFLTEIQKKYKFEKIIEKNRLPFWTADLENFLLHNEHTQQTVEIRQSTKIAKNRFVGCKKDQNKSLSTAICYEPL